MDSLEERIVKKALDEAERRLEKAVPDIEKRHNEGIKNSTDEPQTLISGGIDEIGVNQSINEKESKPNK